MKRKAFIYLASRNKRGIKLIAILLSSTQVNSKLEFLKDLKLTPYIEKRIGELINSNVLLYEPRIETADSYNHLRENLMLRGFKNISTNPIPMLDLGNPNNLPQAETSSLKITKSMIRKQKK